MQLLVDPARVADAATCCSASASTPKLARSTRWASSVLTRMASASWWASGRTMSGAGPSDGATGAVACGGVPQAARAASARTPALASARARAFANAVARARAGAGVGSVKEVVGRKVASCRNNVRGEATVESRGRWSA